MAADVTIAQVSDLVEAGGIDPEQVITPGIFVDHVIEVKNPQQEEILVRTGAVH
jgi:3-oxoadipate CoA-transferase alpha subunit